MLKERKSSQQSRIRVREPDVAVARVSILRAGQQVASWHSKRRIQQELHSRSFTFKVSLSAVLPYFVKHFVMIYGLIENVIFLYLSVFAELKEKRLCIISCVYL